MATGVTAELTRSEASIQTVLDFINTRYDGKGGRIERFGDADDFAAWAREQGMADGDAVSESEAAAARELRAALLTMLLAHSEHQDVTDEQIAAAESHLRHAGQLYPVKVTLSASGARLDGQSRGAAGVLGSVLAAANDLAQQGAWSRMKACCSHPCLHGFVDRTKNGSQRYCDSKCASRAAMRAMRQRQRES
jgi:predicted RNA-binding Zn ribbon-like protein